jgi:N-acyl homoserine lactone hydrolase
MAKVTTLLYGNSLDTNQGGIAFCAVTLIESTGADGVVHRLVVDPGGSGRKRALRDAVAAHGLSRDDIDGVVLTHAHWDHMQNVDEFPRATIYAHADELAYLAAPHRDDFATAGWTRAALDSYDVRAVGDGQEVAAGVSVLCAPGHSPGSIAVTVQMPAGIAVIAGDAIQNPAVALHRRNPLVFFDDALARRSIDRIVDVADVLYPGHDRAFRLTGSGGSDAVDYVEDYGLRITGPSTDLALTTIEADDSFTPLIRGQRAGHGAG